MERGGREGGQAGEEGKEVAEGDTYSIVGVPTIVLCTGEKGRIARVMNRFFTPVTHPLLTTVAAPGQMSVKEIHLARSGLGFIPKKYTLDLSSHLFASFFLFFFFFACTAQLINLYRNFYLFGSPISQSRSPLIHNTGFKVSKEKKREAGG